jgi:hypothetical protein
VIEARRPVEVSLDLPGEASRAELQVQALRADGKGGSRLTGARLESSPDGGQ